MQKAGIDVQATELAANPFGGDQRCSRAEKDIKHQVPALCHVPQSIRDEGGGLHRRMQREVFTPAPGHGLTEA